MAKGRPNRQKPVHRPPASHAPGGGRPGAPQPSASRPQTPESGARPQRRQPGTPPDGPRTPPGRDLVHGRNPVREALRGSRRVFLVFVAEAPDVAAALAEVEGWHEAGRLERGAAAFAPSKIMVLSAADMAHRLGTQDHQGLGAEVAEYRYADSEELLQTHTLIVALDRVQDPHNLGAVVRTAEGVRAAVVIPRHRAAPVTPAVARSSAGATEHAVIAQVRNLTDFLAAAKKAGFWIYGAAADASTSYDAHNYRERTVFVLGSEGEGLGRRVRDTCDQLISLPLQGRVEALNVSVTAGILLYEAQRQRRAAAEEGLSAPASAQPE
jgi:23S rRNA (guanosine2251-2'-O)-methyltransferase